MLCWAEKLGLHNTCHIDQVYGQSWAWQAGIGRLWDKEKTLSALRSLWKYNFAPDVGPYIKTHAGVRQYAVPGIFVHKYKMHFFHPNLLTGLTTLRLFDILSCEK